MSRVLANHLSVLGVRIWRSCEPTGHRHRCLLNSSLTYLQTQERMISSVASRFIDLANPNPDTGESTWVCFRENPELLVT